MATKTGGSSPDWTHIPADEVTTLNTGYTDWYMAYVKTLKPHTSAETAGAKAAFTASYKVLSRFIKVWFRGFPDKVTDEDLKNMGIPPLDPTHTLIGVPPTIPVFTTELRNIRSIVIPFREEGVKSRGIPYGYDGAVVSWDVSGTPVTDPKKLTRSELATRSPHTLLFEEEDRGKTVYIALQWQNESGKKGEFSAVQTAIIP
jgi:hypothetical protein